MRPAPLHVKLLPSRALLARALLAFMLLFAQQTATLHWLSHAVDATHAKAAQGSAPSEHCDECLALGGLGTAATSTAAALAASTAHHLLRAALPASAAVAALRLAFRSRAPPIPS